jgi:diacylglycerol O-acyltransferase 2, plant
MMSNRHREEIYLQRRKGFLKIAQENNAVLVPVYIFGHTRLFDQLANGDGIAMWLSRLIRGSVTFYWGPYFLPVPYVTPLSVVCGKPLAMDWAAPDTNIDSAHTLFCEEVQRLFEANKHDAGYGDATLKIR